MNNEMNFSIAKSNKGYIYSRIIKAYNIPTIYLTRLATEGELKKAC